MPIDPNSLPRDAETLRKIVVDLAEQLDRSLAEQNKYQGLLRELLEAQRNRKSEQGCTSPECSPAKKVYSSGCSYGYMSRKMGYACFCSS